MVTLSRLVKQHGPTWILLPVHLALGWRAIILPGGLTRRSAPTDLLVPHLVVAKLWLIPCSFKLTARSLPPATATAEPPSPVTSLSNTYSESTLANSKNGACPSLCGLF